VIVVVLTLIGFFAAGIAGRLLTRISERVVATVPVARSVYSWTKQVFETVLSQKGTAFREVVLVEYPCRGTWAVGFITGQTEGEIQGLTTGTVFNVFIPATPNPTTGFLLFIPRGDIRHLDMSVEDGIKLVISGGIVTPKVRKSMAPEKQPPRRADAHPEGGARRHGLMRRLRNYFFAGVLVTAPISITIWITWEVLRFVDNRVVPLVPPAWNPETYLPFGLPGLGVLVIVVFLTVVGFFTAGLLGRTLISLGERILDRMPVIRGVYSAVKQLVETVFKEQSRAFREVVLIQYPRPDSWAIGFVTGKAEAHIQQETPEETTTVFLPTTPNPTSGFLLFVPRKEVVPLAMSVEEGIKMVVSGGIVTPPERQKKAPQPAVAE
ncbi:MAG: DUF502 domain-containing protein, partial [Alphaproteobacteria bacterium]